MMTPECSEHVSSLGKTSFLLVGVEAHVCLQQTVLDLLEQGHDVHIIADGVSSQQKYDREMALRQMESSGAWLTSAQSAAYMLLGSANYPNFMADEVHDIDKLDILCHEFNIPQMIEISVGYEGINGHIPSMLDDCRTLQKLGYVRMDCNEHSHHQDRELKTIPIGKPADLINLLM
eukprot:CCRYP_014444-RA/>CCRYP_014444-RA protein AED:0.61 eAED:0.26 QI:0/0/0/0.5/1/1/2/0/175